MSARLSWLDAARGLAVIAMVLFHLTWDLAHFGYIERSIPWSAPVKAFGHGIAFSFLFIAGYSLVLAHRESMNWPSFWRRFAIIAGAAAAVSVGTYVAFPSAWVFFGILHVIAAASLAALPFLHAPWGVTMGVGVLALMAPWFSTSSVFDSDWLMWTGLSTREPMTQDWRPFFPWVGALLVGVAAARAPLSRTSGQQPVAAGGGLTFLGGHSLAIYLAHQPALFALFTALAFFAPAQTDNAAFVGACEKECVTTGSVQKTCREACQCLADAVDRNHGLAGVKSNAERDERLAAFARKCMGR